MQGSEMKLKNEVEELKSDNIEKDTCIVYLEGQISGFVSSLEKACEEAIASFKKSDEYKGRLDSHYAAGYEDFRADAKETFPNLDFDSFKLPLATESSVLRTSSENVNLRTSPFFNRTSLLSSLAFSLAVLASVASSLAWHVAV